MFSFSKGMNRTLEGIIGILIILILLLVFFLLSKPADPSQKTFKSPHGTVTFSEKGGVGPQTSRDILLDSKLIKADFTKDKKSRDFIIDQSRETGSIFIEKNCLISPIAIKWDSNQPLKFINEDTTPHTIFVKNKTYQVSSNSTFIATERLALPEITTIKCDTSNNVQGYIYSPEK